MKEKRGLSSRGEGRELEYRRKGMIFFFLSYGVSTISTVSLAR